MATIVVTGRDAQVTQRGKQHAQDKIAKLERYFDGIGRIEAILGHSGAEAEVELLISVKRGKTIVCRSHAKELYTAIDLVLDKAETQLTKHKERLKAHRPARPDFSAVEKEDAAGDDFADDDFAEDGRADDDPK